MKAIDAVSKFISDPLAAFCNAARQVRTDEAEKRAAYESAVQERQRLVAARAPRSDVLANLESELAELAEAWATSHGLDIVDASGRVACEPSGRITGLVRPVTLSGAVGVIDLGMLAAVLPDALRAGLRRVVEATSYEAGEPLADRAALIATVDLKIAALAAEHEAMVAAAQESGIPLAELDVNRIARLRAQREQEQIAHHNLVNRRAIEQGRLKAAETLEEAR